MGILYQKYTNPSRDWHPGWPGVDPKTFPFSPILQITVGACSTLGSENGIQYCECLERIQGANLVRPKFERPREKENGSFHDHFPKLWGGKVPKNFQSPTMSTCPFFVDHLCHNQDRGHLSNVQSPYDIP